MADKQWNHRLHGDGLHDIVIYLVEAEVMRKDGKLKPTRDFRGKTICPCEPDVYFEIDTKLIEGNKRIHQKGLYVVEVETKATNQSRLKKYQQYKESLAGLTDLIVIDLENDYRAYVEGEGLGITHSEALKNWDMLRDFVRTRLPI